MRFTLDNALRIGEILSQTARIKIMSRFAELIAGQVREKSSRFGLVTNADEAAERAISTALETPIPARSSSGRRPPLRDRRRVPQ